MKKIQRQPVKIVTLLFSLLLSSSLFGQQFNYRLQKADSLFAAKFYTQSLELYEVILAQRHYTPAMLLKMAYVHEGLNEIGRALHYLNLHYLATGDGATAQKMQELSRKYNLTGYGTANTNEALAMYENYRLPVSFTLAALVFFFFSLAVFMKRRKHQPVLPLVLLGLFAVILAVHLFYHNRMQTVIIAHPNTYVMTGPSGASSVLSVISEGHRVPVTGRKDVWVEIEWQGKTAYVKETAALPVRL